VTDPLGESARSRLLKAAATAGAVALIVLVLLRLLGPKAPYTTFFWHIFSGTSPDRYANSGTDISVLATIGARVPFTLELIVVSLLVAAVAGVAGAALQVRTSWPIVTVAAVVLRSVPFFYLAIGMQMLLAVNVQIFPTAGYTGVDDFNLADRLWHLALPSGALALFALPTIVEYFKRRLAVAAHARRSEVPIAAELAVIFAARLPELLSAAVVTEVIFAWPGEGRLLFDATFASGAIPIIAGILLFNALFVLAIRVVVREFVRQAPGDDSVYDA